MKIKPGKLFIVSGPSGSGKTTLCKMIMDSEEMKPLLLRSISFTTRSMRLGEIDGRDYFFVTKEIFDRYRGKGWLLEHKNVLENFYGTPKKYVKDCLKKGKDMLLCVDINGARQIKKSAYKKSMVTIFIMPPSFKVLEERLRFRSTETERAINERLKLARKEVKAAKEYDYVICNDKVDWALQELKSIVLAENCRRLNVADSFRKIIR